MSVVFTCDLARQRRLSALARSQECRRGRSLDRRYPVLFAIELATRRVDILGIIPEPDGPRMKQIARNVANVFSGVLWDKKYFIIDPGLRFTKTFRKITRESDVDVIRLPPR